MTSIPVSPPPPLSSPISKTSTFLSLNPTTSLPSFSFSSSSGAAAVHARALRLNLLPSSPSLSFHLLRHYATTGDPFSATALLPFLPAGHHLTVVAFNLLIRAFSSSLPYHALDLFLEMAQLGLTPNEFTFPFVLKSCAALSLLHLGLQIHAHLAKSGLFRSNVFCGSALLDFYVKVGSLGDALLLFDRIPERNVVTWNSMISAYIQDGFLEEALRLMGSMADAGLEVGVTSWNSVIAGCVRLGDVDLALKMLGEMVSDGRVGPNAATFNTLLSVIPMIQYLERLKQLHGFALRNAGAVDFDPIDFDRLCSAVASGYAFHGYMEYAFGLFRDVKLKICQLSNSMISGYLDSGQTRKAFDVFRDMAFQCCQDGQILSRISLTLVLPECGRVSKSGLEIHAYAYRNGMESGTSVSNALMAMYAKRGDRESAEKVFQGAPEKDTISWNTMISSYAVIHDFDRAFELFQEMIANGIRPDEYSFSSVLSGCGFSSYLRQGIALHGQIIKAGFCQPVVQNALMDAYGKCGCIEDAQKAFDEVVSKDIISWNTIISCYGFSDSPHEAISLFHKMQEQGYKPNRVTFIALLSACSHAGLLDEGFHYFETMSSQHGVVPDLDHYSCIVDGLGRAGQLDRAYQFIKDMPVQPDDCIWGALLSSCRLHGHVELAEIAAKNLIELDPQHSGYWVLLSNTYADASRWRDVAHVRAAMKDAGVKKCPGFSWIEIGGSEIHRFLTGDKLHKHCDDIYIVLDGLTEQLKDEGYIPHIDHKFILIDQEIEDQDMIVG
ncbi:pentatricopeptide repeat-containing protein At4g19191, mitochondrial-like [Typha latifolia]|uniref:pentatricopeptide repeat-containing protein At4g19191, mitochondrial-like n=1 Tax=Typha latifolia TaxID=4733 RepID=UPI003C2B2D2B